MIRLHLALKGLCLLRQLLQPALLVPLLHLRHHRARQTQQIRAQIKHSSPARLRLQAKSNRPPKHTPNVFDESDAVPGEDLPNEETKEQKSAESEETQEDGDYTMVDMTTSNPAGAMPSLRKVNGDADVYDMSMTRLFEVLWSDPAIRVLFPNMLIVMAIAVLLPISTVWAERAFSHVKLLKTRLRTLLGAATLDALMRICLMSPKNIMDVDDSFFEEVVNEFAKKKDRRHDFGVPDARLHPSGSKKQANRRDDTKNASFENKKRKTATFTPEQQEQRQPEQREQQQSQQQQQQQPEPQKQKQSQSSLLTFFNKQS
jgi:hypothetical protein